MDDSKQNSDMKRDSVGEEDEKTDNIETGKPKFTREVRRLSMGLPITFGIILEINSGLNSTSLTFTSRASIING